MTPAILSCFSRYEKSATRWGKRRENNSNTKPIEEATGITLEIIFLNLSMHENLDYSN